MRATFRRLASPGTGWLINRPNRVPHYQRLFQSHDGKRQWMQTSRSKYLLYPYYVLVWGNFAAVTYCMIRLTLGHKTWFGKG